MAINYLNKLFESTVVADPKTIAFGVAVPANSLVIVGFTARRAAGVPGVTSVSDSKGNTYTTYNINSATTNRIGVTYCRTSVALSTSDTFTLDWSVSSIDSMWISGHAFDNVLLPRHSQAYNGIWDGGGDNPQITVAVTGSDWLTFACFKSDEDTITPVNSSLSRDDNDVGTGSSEVFSRNGTTGTTHTIGGTHAVTGRYWAGVAVSFIVDPSGSSIGNIRGQKTLIGV